MLTSACFSCWINDIDVLEWIIYGPNLLALLVDTHCSYLFYKINIQCCVDYSCHS